MSAPLPPRPRLGRRERAFYLTMAWVSLCTVSAYLGAPVSETVTMAVVTLAGVVIGGDTYRASGTGKGGE